MVRARELNPGPLDLYKRQVGNALVTESAGKVCGGENRDGYVRETLLSRFAIPKYDQKSDFKDIPTKGLCTVNNHALNVCIVGKGVGATRSVATSKAGFWFVSVI